MAKKRPTHAEELEELYPAGFDPEPTVFPGGIDRMIQLWEKSRDQNVGGYGGNRLFKCGDWAGGGIGSVTSCSPFTAIIIGQMFDTSGNDGKGPKEAFQPMFDGGKKPIPKYFYNMHNGNFIHYDKDPKTGKNVPDALSKIRQEHWRKHKQRMPLSDINHSALSCVYMGLAYEIDPRDMRRGDMVGIHWVSRGGHATFCWDVHVSEEGPHAGEVDCFQYLSSNGNGSGGPGVSIGTVPWNLFLNTKTKDKFKKTVDKYFSDEAKGGFDFPFVTEGKWCCIPGHFVSTDIKRETFKAWPNHVVGTDNGGKFAVAELKVARFYGFHPPEKPHGNILTDSEKATALKYAKWQPPEPFSKGSCTKPAKAAKSKKVKKTEPEPTKAAPKDNAQQKKDEAVPHQRWVEGVLAELFEAKWIEKDPGQPDATADAQSKAALEDFQAKWKIEPAHGRADKKTRDALERAHNDLRAGKPNPHDTKRKPKLDQFYFSPNTIEPGGSVTVGVKGENLDLVKSYTVSLNCGKTGATDSATLRIVSPTGTMGSEPLKVAAKFAAGCELKLKLSGDGIDQESKALLYIKKAVEPNRDWPWDETKWPTHVRDMIKQLRTTPKGPGKDIQKRRITQYGVWSVPEGDTPVIDKHDRTIGRADKRQLYLADVAGTMRLDGKILNLVESGNVFDGKGNMPDFDKFNPKKSKWLDVSSDAPWGMGAKMPLIPFRTLAAKETSLYGKKVYIAELEGIKLPNGEAHNGICIVGDTGAVAANQLDLFVGPDGGRLGLPSQCNIEIL